MWVYVHLGMYSSVFGTHLWCCVSQQSPPLTSLWGHSATWLTDHISDGITACYCSRADLVMTVVLLLPLLFGFLAIFLSVVGLDLLPISTVRSPDHSARIMGEPDATTNQPWPLSYLSGTRLVVSCHAVATRNKKQEGEAHMGINLSSTFFSKRTTCKIKPEACFLFISHPDLLALHCLKPSNPLSWDLTVVFLSQVDLNHL